MMAARMGRLKIRHHPGTPRGREGDGLMGLLAALIYDTLRDALMDAHDSTQDDYALCGPAK